jgi:hypothetical protein
MPPIRVRPAGVASLINRERAERWKYRTAARTGLKDPLAPCQVEQSPGSQETAPRLGFNPQGRMRPSQFAARAGLNWPFACDLFPQLIGQIQIFEGELKQDTSLGGVAPIRNKFLPKRDRSR